MGVYAFNVDFFFNCYIILGFLTALFFFFMMGPEELTIIREINNEENGVPNMPHWFFMIMVMVIIIYHWPLFIVKWSNWDG